VRLVHPHEPQDHRPSHRPGKETEDHDRSVIEKKVLQVRQRFRVSAQQITRKDPDLHRHIE
jgi:hypothetical protein